MNKHMKRYISLAALLLVGCVATAQVKVDGSVYGGGNLAEVDGSTTVTVNQGGASVENDVYGGGALADVGTLGTTSHIVFMLNGTVKGAVYGGGLGDGDHAAKVNGEVTVNIGTSLDNGNATLSGASVFGGNNANGSPQDDVTVHIWKTAHTTDDDVDGSDFAIANVFGGGNEAGYVPATALKKCLVYVHGCENTIGRSFGGGNAADVGTADAQGTVTLRTDVETIIEGGRLGQVFGGGNGEVTAANINGNLSLEIHGGDVGQFYGASNERGTISGDISVDVDSEGACGELTINELFSGSNLAPITGNLTTNINCSTTGDLTINNLYGGCNQANISGGDVVLNVYGGHYINVYGGSCGTPTSGADIQGNVTLNLYGGTIENAFGGSNVKGNITGTITVNVLDEEGSCPLYVTNIYGGSNMADYIPTFTPASGSERISPVVNVVHAKYGISGNVYGGSKGVEGATGEDETIVKETSPLVNIGYDADMNGSLPSAYVDFISDENGLSNNTRVIIGGSVYGGGDAAKVQQGNTAIYLRNRAKVFGNVYGGGNMGEVDGNTKVIVNGVVQ